MTTDERIERLERVVAWVLARSFFAPLFFDEMDRPEARDARNIIDETGVESVPTRGWKTK